MVDGLGKLDEQIHSQLSKMGMSHLQLYRGRGRLGEDQEDEI